MKIKSRYFFFLTCLFPFLLGCSEKAKGQQKADKVDQMELYRAQDHRFEIKGCQLYYNEQHVVLVLDSVETFERIFGSNYENANSMRKFFMDKPLEFFLKDCTPKGGEFRACIGRLNIFSASLCTRGASGS